MKKSTIKRINQQLITGSILSTALFTQTQAAPLPNGTLLSIENKYSSVSLPCASDSCFGMEVAPGFVVWTRIEAGTDGGILVGKNQASGGQETMLTPITVPLDPITSAPGELSAAWKFFGNWGTFYSPEGTTNMFDDASCAGASCIGKIELNSWNAAWNGTSVPMGSADGCKSPSCSADQLAGIFITDYTIATGGNGPYSMIYGNVVPDGDPSGFGNVKYSLVLRGIAVPPPPTPTPTPTAPVPTPVPTPICDTLIINDDVFSEGQTGKLIPWIPHIFATGISTCWISTAPSSGTATVAENCSSGTFIADQPGVYTFKYDSEIRPDGGCYSIDDRGPGIVTVTVNESSTPIAKDLSISNTSGATTEVSTGYSAWIGTCGIESPPLNGVAEMGDLCSSVLYTSNEGYSGSDSFQYFLQDKLGKYVGNVSVSVSPSICIDKYPSRSIKTVGKGQSDAVNSTMTTTFTGHIVSTDDGTGKVSICPGTTVDYSVTTTIGTATCTVKHGVSTGTTGTLTDKGKLVCTNKPDGKDTDRFKIKRSKKKDVAKERRWHR